MYIRRGTKYVHEYHLSWNSKRNRLQYFHYMQKRFLPRLHAVQYVLCKWQKLIYSKCCKNSISCLSECYCFQINTFNNIVAHLTRSEFWTACAIRISPSKIFRFRNEPSKWFQNKSSWNVDEPIFQFCLISPFQMAQPFINRVARIRRIIQLQLE